MCKGNSATMNFPQGIRHLVTIGIDEAGRGPLAGPVTAAAVVLRAEDRFEGLTDSKKLSEKKREVLFEAIQAQAVAYSVISLGPEEIDVHNIREATRLAMARAADEVMAKIPMAYAYLLIDGNMNIPSKFPHEFVIKGDQKVAAISAASILAKVSRDRMMCDFDHQFPQYGFSKHKGYPTKSHRESIKEHGPCSIHRKTFAGVKEFVSV